MTPATTAASNNQKAKFTPKMDNFKVSLSYEGISLKKSSEGKSIDELKRKYAR
jgi:hypothetical protein